MSSKIIFSKLLSLEGKTALVSGGSGGIGKAVVETLQQAGARVWNLDRPGKESPSEVRFIPCDLSKVSELENFSSKIHALGDSLDFFVHCAGITRDAVLWKLKKEDWEEVMAVNLHSAFYLMKACVPLLRKKGGGSVVLLSSINGERGKFGQANYAASKAGLIALGKTAARELGRFGIRVNSIAPGMIRTEMTARLPQEAWKQAEAETVLSRIGEPADVAHAVLFLCSEMSQHVTGQVLRVDGGQWMA